MADNDPPKRIKAGDLARISVNQPRFSFTSWYLRKYPKMAIYTIHDSIVAPAQYHYEVRELMATAIYDQRGRSNGAAKAARILATMFFKEFTEHELVAEVQ